MDRGINRLFLPGILLIALLFRLKGLNNPLLDNQGWRQADTAGMAIHMLGHLGDFPDVFFPHLNYDGVIPQKVELEFPFLPYILAWTWTFFGWADFWGRLWAVVFSLLTVLGIYDLGRRVFSERVGLISSAFYAVLPMSVYYGRVVMPEPVMQAFAIWALDLLWRWRWNGFCRKGYPVWSALLMAGAILAKLPQLMLFPVALVLGFWPWQRERMRDFFVFSLISLLPPLIYYSWTHFGSDQVSQFVSGIINEQVISNRTLHWHELSKNMRKGLTFIVPYLAAGGLIRLFWARAKEHLGLVVWSIIAAAYIVVVCTRIPLDYYLVPVLPLLAILSAYAVDWLADIPGMVSTVVVFCLIWFASYHGLGPNYDWDSRYLVQADWLARNTPVQSVLVLSDPPPMTFYYAHRVGFRLKQEGDAAALVELSQLPGQYLVVLPGTTHKQVFLNGIKQRYPEVGPGVFKLQP